MIHYASKVSSGGLYARRIGGWLVNWAAHASCVLEALEPALHERRSIHRGHLVNHSSRGSQYVSIRYTYGLAEAGIRNSKETASGKAGAVHPRQTAWP
jgi:transposase InsO family protein